MSKIYLIQYDNGVFAIIKEKKFKYLDFFKNFEL